MESMEELTRKIREAAARVTHAPSWQEYRTAYQEWADLCTQKERMMAAEFDQ